MSRCPAFQEFHKIYITDYCKNYHLNHCLQLIEQFAEEHKGTLDGELALELRAFWHIIMVEFDEALTILDRYENSEHDLSRIFTYKYLIRYYGGWMNPSIDLKKREEYYQKHQNLHPKLVLTNDWEKAFFGIFKIQEEYEKEIDYEKKAKYIPNLRRLMNKVPEYGATYSLWLENNYAGVFYSIGKFEEARESFELTIKFYKNADISGAGYNGLIGLAINQGKMEEAEMYLNKIWDLVEEGDNHVCRTILYSTKARIAELRLNLEEAEIVRFDIVAMNESKGNALHVFRALYNLFEFYNRVYSFTDNYEYYKRAVNTHSKLETIAQNHQNDSTMKRLTKMANAELMKHGGIKDRSKSITMFEELLEVYPTSLDIKMQLVELYFEDLGRDPTGEAKRIIDSYLDEIQKSPLMKNPTKISEYSIYQILIAKYIYYLEGDIDKALHILYDLREQAEKFGLKPVEENISKEITTLEDEIQKWNNVQLTTKERIEKSKIQSYFKSALKLIGSTGPEE
ncbi:MAG: hypothetical protein HeimC3_47660 [Candidatus Heimdallarchaeota archaeon LC_3]|nr:MAG: hypothetical protein HeimC3_47660 [Candidatus Heimdallarchaeota archaeon LC_3]